MRTNDILKSFPPESHSWAGKVTFSFSYPHSGWLQWAITCTAYVQNVVIACSNVFDPFPGLFKWLEAIAAGQLPAEIIIDEEGHGKVLRASPLNNYEFIFEILLWDWNKNSAEERPIFLYAQVNRVQFVAEFVRQWDDFIANRYAPEEWVPHGSDDLRKLDMAKLREFVQG